jgi:hypothetical protein
VIAAKFWTAAKIENKGNWAVGLEGNWAIGFEGIQALKLRTGNQERKIWLCAVLKILTEWKKLKVPNLILHRFSMNSTVFW